MGWTCAPVESFLRVPGMSDLKLPQKKARRKRRLHLSLNERVSAFTQRYCSEVGEDSLSTFINAAMRATWEKHGVDTAAILRGEDPETIWQKSLLKK
jgi:hypothetical protein